MFSKFFYTCKSKGLKITLSEWLNLQEALDKGLCESSLTKFYYIARMLLVKSETEYDKFDMAFEECFKAVKKDTEITKEMLKWLDKPDMTEILHELFFSLCVIKGVIGGKGHFVRFLRTFCPLFKDILS